MENKLNIAANEAISKDKKKLAPKSNPLSDDMLADASNASAVNLTESTQSSLPDSSASLPWAQFVKNSEEGEIKNRFSLELKQILDSHSAILSPYAVMAIMSSNDSIDYSMSDAIFAGLCEKNAKKEKDVLLVLHSTGGYLEAVYQISTLCKAYSRQRFIVIVPRLAKSGATLISMGADEIHMGPLSQLGPIDPQINGLPALGVVQAIELIASIAEKHPGSSDFFAKYLNLAMSVSHIGYSDRVGEAAVQYAMRLLATKSFLKGKEQQIAKDFVYEYKIHDFLIDLEEAQERLGAEWVKTETPELQFAEQVYRLFENANSSLVQFRRKRISVIGSITNSPLLRIDNS